MKNEAAFLPHIFFPRPGGPGSRREEENRKRSVRQESPLPRGFHTFPLNYSHASREGALTLVKGVWMASALAPLSCHDREGRA